MGSFREFDPRTPSRNNSVCELKAKGLDLDVRVWVLTFLRPSRDRDLVNSIYLLRVKGPLPYNESHYTIIYFVRFIYGRISLW